MAKIWVEDKRMLKKPTDFIKFWRMRKQVTGGIGISYGEEENTKSVVIQDFGDATIAIVENIDDLKTAEIVARKIMDKCQDWDTFELCAVDVCVELEEEGYGECIINEKRLEMIKDYIKGLYSLIAWQS